MNRSCASFFKNDDHDLAFELNCKSMYLYGHEKLYLYALGLVKELGGQRFSVGSDGHKLEHFRLKFDRVAQILANAGIEEMSADLSHSLRFPIAH